MIPNQAPTESAKTACILGLAPYVEFPGTVTVLLTYLG